MDTLQINIIAIIIGVLLARIIYIWVMTFKLYAESTESYDHHIYTTDCSIFKKKFVAALISTAISGFIIILIIEVFSPYR